MQLDLIAVEEPDIQVLLSLMSAYYNFEQLEFDQDKARMAVKRLISDGRSGKIWLINFRGDSIGYVAVTFGFSLEFGGKDAFIDEIFILDPYRRKGIGTMVLKLVEIYLKNDQVMALHLEVDRKNHKAKHFYRSQGFESRERYHLMSKSL